MSMSHERWEKWIGAVFARGLSLDQIVGQAISLRFSDSERRFFW